MRLRDGIGERSIRSVATAAGVSHVTILNVLAGRAWPDLSTIARLEIALGVPLWPGLQVARGGGQGAGAPE
jgi:transcriptional regulator with XRE-family HTH domain